MIQGYICGIAKGAICGITPTLLTVKFLSVKADVTYKIMKV